MSRKEKAAFVIKKLEEIYPSVDIPLDHEDPFTLLIATMLSAQTTDVAVNKVTPALFRRAKTPQKMMRLSVDDILSIIRFVGLAPTKAKNAKEISRLIVERHKGVVPQTFEELEALPGVGHKTASVVMSQAFGKSAFPVDTHIHRLMFRWGLSNGKNVVQTEEDAKKLFPEKLWNKLHLQIIYFGRNYCPAKKHKKEECPVCSVIGRE